MLESIEEMIYEREGIRKEQSYLPLYTASLSDVLSKDTIAGSPKAETKQHQRLGVTSSCQLSAANLGSNKEFLI
jgi:hypothetical protein